MQLSFSPSLSNSTYHVLYTVLYNECYMPAYTVAALSPAPFVHGIVFRTILYQNRNEI